METRPKRLFLTVLPQNILVPSQQSLAFFLQENPPLLLKDLQVLAGTGSLITRRWNGRGGGWQGGPGIAGSQSSLGAVSIEQVSAPVLLGESVSCGVVSESGIHAGSENTLDDADFAGAGAENDFHDAQVVVPGSSGAATRLSMLGPSGGCGEVNLRDAQLLLVAGLLGKGTSRCDPMRGQREVAELLTTGPSSSPVSSAVGRCSAVNLHGAQLGAGPSCSLQDDVATVNSSVGRRQRRARGARVRQNCIRWDLHCVKVQ